MVDRLFAEPRLAALYDAFCPWGDRGDFDFYLPYAMSAPSVLDVGCGTGLFLKGVRDRGHRGRLCGLDPADGMLLQARARTDIEWFQGDASSACFDHEFDLVVMTGHAFQVLVADDEIRAALAAIKAALRRGGRFAFETRNPLARAWQQWTPADPQEVTLADGAVVRMTHDVTRPFDGNTVSFRVTYTSPSWPAPEVSHSTLRFLDETGIAAFLRDEGFTIDAQYGDWDGRPLRAESPEIITIARS